MNDRARKWDDLTARLLSGLSVGAVGLSAILLGGVWLNMFVALLAGVMIWELVRMLSPDQQLAAQGLAAGTGICVFVVNSLPSQPVWLGLVGLLLAGLVWLKSGRLVFLFYTPIVLLGAVSAFVIRAELGQSILLLVAAVVIVTDVAGYFVGRTIGGPKFWPKVSPKKTWSGTIAGWVGAAIISVPFAEPRFGVVMAVVAVILAFASQLGDIGESAIKRRCGVKDSSGLLPGHGGFMDRFDGMIAALAASYIVWIMVGGWPVAG